MSTTTRSTLQRGVKALSVALCGSLLISAIATQSAQADSPVFSTADNGDGTVTITGCSANCPTKALIIPRSVAGKKVTAIGNQAFQNRLLTSIELPDTVITIGSEAFDNNMFSSLTIPNSVTTISLAAFYNNNPLETVTIGRGVTFLGNWSFGTSTLKYLTFLGDAPTFEIDPFDGTPYLTSVIVPSDAIGFGDTVAGVAVSRTGPAIHIPAPTAPSYKSAAKITGQAKVGKTATVKKGTWTGSAKIMYSYKWYSCRSAVKAVVKTGKLPRGCKAISKATKSKLKFTAKQKNSFIVVLISAKNSVKTTKIVTAAVGPVK